MKKLKICKNTFQNLFTFVNLSEPRENYIDFNK